MRRRCAPSRTTEQNEKATARDHAMHADSLHCRAFDIGGTLPIDLSSRRARWIDRDPPGQKYQCEFLRNTSRQAANRERLTLWAGKPSGKQRLFPFFKQQQRAISLRAKERQARLQPIGVQEIPAQRHTSGVIPDAAGVLHGEQNHILRRLIPYNSPTRANRRMVGPRRLHPHAVPTSRPSPRGTRQPPATVRNGGS